MNTDALSLTRTPPTHNEGGFLQPLLDDLEVTEIFLLGHQRVSYEKKGVILTFVENFPSLVSFQNFIHQVSEEAKMLFNYDMPFANGHWQNFRVHVASPPVCAQTTLTLRRIHTSSRKLHSFQGGDRWTTLLHAAVRAKQNILVVGGTGSGKTTMLNSLVAQAPEDRCVFIEDTDELLPANDFSTKLLTRIDYQKQFDDILQEDLLKQSLRMRPDRLIVGEIRGKEAKDLLMALSTGHSGSMASMHAGSAAEALLRLEMLVQMGAPQWNLMAIRRLIQLTIHTIVVTKKSQEFWSIDGLYRISSLEEFGFSLESFETMGSM